MICHSRIDYTNWDNGQASARREREHHLFLSPPFGLDRVSIVGRINYQCIELRPWSRTYCMQHINQQKVFLQSRAKCVGPWALYVSGSKPQNRRRRAQKKKKGSMGWGGPEFIVAIGELRSVGSGRLFAIMRRGDEICRFIEFGGGGATEEKGGGDSCPHSFRLPQGRLPR
jgi:hypothetical protein